MAVLILELGNYRAICGQLATDSYCSWHLPMETNKTVHMAEELHLVTICLLVLIFSGALSQIVVERNEKAYKHVA